MNKEKSPLVKTKPPMTRKASRAKEPNVFATIMFLPSAPMNRKSADAIWLIHRRRKYCLKNLQLRIFNQYKCYQARP